MAASAVAAPEVSAAPEVDAGFAEDSGVSDAVVVVSLADSVVAAVCGGAGAPSVVSSADSDDAALEVPVGAEEDAATVVSSADSEDPALEVLVGAAEVAGWEVPVGAAEEDSAGAAEETSAAEDDAGLEVPADAVVAPDVAGPVVADDDAGEELAGAAEDDAGAGVPADVVAAPDVAGPVVAASCNASSNSSRRPVVEAAAAKVAEVTPTSVFTAAATSFASSLISTPERSRSGSRLTACWTANFGASFRILACERVIRSRPTKYTIHLILP